MACKLSPTASVHGITLGILPNSVKVAVVIEGVFSDLLKDEELSKYIRAVCVLSIYDPDAEANANTVNPESVFELNGYWANTEWYELWDGYLRAEKVQSEHYVDFDIDLSSLLTQGEWNKAYLSYFTYIQVDTQQMAEDFNITIADEYKGLAGDYETGVIMRDGEVVDPAAVIVLDHREPVNSDTPANNSCTETKSDTSSPPTVNSRSLASLND